MTKDEAIVRMFASRAQRLAQKNNQQAEIDKLNAALHERDETIAKLQGEVEKLREVIRRAPHAVLCGVASSFMAGGVSLDINSPPNAHPIKGPCDCWKKDAESM